MRQPDEVAGPSRVAFAGLLTVVLGASALAGCGSGDAEAPCTLTGAAWGADVAIDQRSAADARRLLVDLCRSDDCERLASASPVQTMHDFYFANVDPEEGVDGPLTVVATLVSQDGRRLTTSSAPTELVARYPNGDDCPSQTVLESVSLAL